MIAVLAVFIGTIMRRSLLRHRQISLMRRCEKDSVVASIDC